MAGRGSSTGLYDRIQTASSQTMKAAQYFGPENIEIGIVPKPMITAPKDAIVRVTHCTICGLDLHMYVRELDSALKKGDIMGHEAIGIVEEVGSEIKDIKAGDHKSFKGNGGDVWTPSLWYLWLFPPHRRLPRRSSRILPRPERRPDLRQSPKDIEATKLFGLADVTPIAWHGCELAEVQKGDVVGVWGYGAVGLSIQRLALFRGAKRVYAVDKDPHRLALAEKFGMIPINVNKHKDVADHILQVEPMGLDRGIEASGFRSTNSAVHATLRALMLEGDSGYTVSAVIKATRKGGIIALIGDFSFNTYQFPTGALMENTITLRGGQLMAQKYYPYLLDIIQEGKYGPSFMFTAEDSFEDISENYARFNEHKISGGLKVCLVTEFGRSLQH